MYSENKAILAGDAVTLDHFGDLPRDLGHLGQSPRIRSETNVDSNRKSQSAWIHIETISHNDAGLFQAMNTLGHRRRGHPNAATEFRHRQAGIALKFPQQPNVNAVK